MTATKFKYRDINDKDSKLYFSKVVFLPDPDSLCLEKYIVHHLKDKGGFYIVL